MRPILRLLAALAGLTLSLALRAAPVAFDIPAQPAGPALLAFAKQAGVEVLFPAAELRDVTASPVSGAMEPEEALALLLRDTGFAAKRKSPRRFVIKRVARPSEKEALPGPMPTESQVDRDAALGAPDPVDPEDQIVRLADYVVMPSHFGIGEERLAGVATLTREDLRLLPQVGEDLFRTIARLPGLAANDYTARFLVRGAPNSQMLARLDGVDLVDAFHLKEYDGALSIVDLETIESVDLVTGGLTAEYGDRLVGVLNMETQDAVRPGHATTLALSVTHLRATNQGSFADGKGYWGIAARRGYVDLALKLGGADAKDAPTYYDVSGKLEYKVTPNHTVSFHLLHAGDTFDHVDQPPDPDFHNTATSSYLWTRWRGRFGNHVNGEAVLSYTTSERERHGGEGWVGTIHPISVFDERDFNTVALRQDWAVEVDPRVLLRTGVEFSSTRARYDYDLSAERYATNGGDLLIRSLTRDVNLAPDGNRKAGYATVRLQPWNRLIIESGLRYERHSHTGDSGWTPRLNASLNLGRTTVRAAWGLYRQAEGLHELSVQDGQTTFRPAERAEQRVVGVSHRLRSGLELRLEAYERLTTDVRPYWDNLIDPFELYSEALYDRVLLSPSRGRARGVEVSAQYRLGRSLTWSASYAWSHSDERIGNRWVPRNWQQTHTFYADLTWIPARDWEISLAWQYHTGWPYTDIIYEPYPLNDGTLVYTWHYGPVRGLRGPAYHRLDFRATRTIRLRDTTLRFFVDVFNAYNKENQVGFDQYSAWVNDGELVVNKTPGTMLPLLPSAGVTWEF